MVFLKYVQVLFVNYFKVMDRTPLFLQHKCKILDRYEFGDFDHLSF